MTSLLYRISDINQIINPKGILTWLDSQVGVIRYACHTLMETDVPAEGDTWRIVKLYNRVDIDYYQYTIFIEFQTATDLMHFKLVWG
jgi:hypothetical protein